MIFAIPHDFSNEEFAEVGRLLWAFTVLEDEFARAAMKLRFDAATGSGQIIDDNVRKIVKGNFGGRFRCFISALKARDAAGLEAAWIKEAEVRA